MQKTIKQKLSLGFFLNDIMTDCYKSASEVSKELGLPLQRFKKIEDEKESFKLSEIKKLSKKLGVSENFLLKLSIEAELRKYNFNKNITINDCDKLFMTPI